jgi:hypothetical protein
VRKAGYGVIDVECRDVDEISLLVVGKSGDDGGALLGHLKHLGKKYGQDSILHKPHNSDKASLHRTNETEKDKHIEVGSWHPNRTAEFHLLMKNRRPITAGEQFHFITEKSFFRERKDCIRCLSDFGRPRTNAVPGVAPISNEPVKATMEVVSVGPSSSP